MGTAGCGRGPPRHGTGVLIAKDYGVSEVFQEASSFAKRAIDGNRICTEERDDARGRTFSGEGDLHLCHEHFEDGAASRQQIWVRGKALPRWNCRRQSRAR